MRRCQRDMVLRYLAAPALSGGQEALRHVGRIEGAAPAGTALGAALAALAECQADPGMPAQLRSILGNANSESMLHSLIFQRIQQLVKLEALQEALLQCAPGRLHPVSAERGPPRAPQHSSAEPRQPARFADVAPTPQLGHSTVRVAQEQLAKVHLRSAASHALHGSHGGHFGGVPPAVLKRRSSNEGDEPRTLVKKASLSAFDPLKVSKPKPVESPAPAEGTAAAPAPLKCAARLATDKENLASEPVLIVFSPKRSPTKAAPATCVFSSTAR